MGYSVSGARLTLATHNNLNKALSLPLLFYGTIRKICVVFGSLRQINIYSYHHKSFWACDLEENFILYTERCDCDLVRAGELQATEVSIL